MRTLAVLAALAGFSWFTTEPFRLPFPGPAELRSAPADAVQDMAVLSLGLRRPGADLEFIRLLQYYGSPEGETEAEHEAHAGRPHPHHEGGVYAEILPRTLRLLDLDPYFTYAALFSAGALAFNLDRPEEALKVLSAAMTRRPNEWRYHSYMAAIGYHRARDPERVIRILEPYVWQAETPTLVKNVVGFLMRRSGHFDEAKRVYQNILATSSDPGYQDLARRVLRGLPEERKAWRAKPAGRRRR